MYVLGSQLYVRRDNHVIIKSPQQSHFNINYYFHLSFCCGKSMNMEEKSSIDGVVPSKRHNENASLKMNGDVEKEGPIGKSVQVSDGRQGAGPRHAMFVVPQQPAGSASTSKVEPCSPKSMEQPSGSSPKLQPSPKSMQQPSSSGSTPMQQEEANYPQVKPGDSTF